MHRDLVELLIGRRRRATIIHTSIKSRPWTSDGFSASWSKEMARRAMAAHRQAGLVFHACANWPWLFFLEACRTDAEVSAILAIAADGRA